MSKRIGVLGYYGSDAAMTARNYKAMIAECVGIITDDFQLDLADCTFVGVGGTWSQHIPVELWKLGKSADASRMIFVLASEFDIERKRFAKNEINNSHSKMYNRLSVNNNADCGRSLWDIASLLTAGAAVRSAGNYQIRDRLFAESCDHLIYLPLTEEGSGTDAFYGRNTFEQFTGPKRLLAWSDVVQQS